MRPILLTLTFLLFGVASGCGGGDDPGPSAGDGPAPSEQQSDDAGARFPEVVKVEAEPADDGAYDFSVTISSPYDSPERYADGWRVKTEAGDVLGEMTLGHDHATEQPFTRDQFDVSVPSEVKTVVVEGHDLENGYGGQTATVKLP